jgi:hypothetical protein
VGPTSAYSSCPSGQALALPRHRRCLLKGCEAQFRGSHPLARYCSEACSRAARRWSQWRANCRYRQSEQGKERRRQQCQRRRERQCSPAVEPAAPCEREGYHQADKHEKTPCRRPGCYESFAFSARSPLKKFCSPLCRQALRRVLEREARWRRRLWQQSNSVYANSGRDRKPPDLSVAY